MKYFVALLVLAGCASTPSKPPNCKLTVRTLGKDRKEKVEVVEVYATSREDCKAQAKEREVILDPNETLNIRATYGYRGED